MKSYEIKYWGYWLAFLMILFLMVSCKSAAPIENKTDEKNFKFKFDSSVVKVIKTQDIHDS